MKTAGQTWWDRALTVAASGLAGVLLCGLGGTRLIGAEAGPVGARYPGLRINEFLRNWLVLGPIPAAPGGREPDEASQRNGFANDLLAGQGGERGVQPRADATQRVGELSLTWRLVKSAADIVPLDAELGRKDYVVAYAWAEVVSAERTAVLLGLGSDDGVKVWLNGRLIHENWARRATTPDEDVVPATLNQGTNTVLLKIQNGQGGWSFCCRRVGSEALVEKLIGAARAGDLVTVKSVLGQGVDINAASKTGLTALQTARVHGQKDIADYLLAQKADAHRQFPAPAEVIDHLFEGVVKEASPGAAVLVARDGKVLLEKGYGYASLEHHTPITPATKFRIGSITKQFTAAAILKLQAAGKLRVQDRLSRYVPDFPRGEEVTLAHLLTHTSGIHSYTSKPDFLSTALLPTKTDELINSFKPDPYDFDPGKKWLYNNSGYFLLGFIIEKVSGAGYGPFLSTTFFEPLDMRHTGVHHASDILADEATGYAYEDGRTQKAPNWDMSRAGAAGALFSTVGDLHRWNEAVFGGKLLAEADLKAAFTPVRTADDAPGTPKEEGYGYGWAMAKFRGLREVSHGGGLNGFSSFLMRLPAERFTVVILANAAPPPPGLDPAGLAHQIAQLYLWEKMEARLTPLASSQVSPRSYDAYTGRYDYGAAILTVTREGDRLFAQLSGQPKFEIFPKSETEFFWKVVEAQVTFVKNERGEVTKAVHRQGGQTINAARLAEVQTLRLTVAQLEAVVGRYDYGGGKLIMEVTRDSERLFAQLTGQPKMEIFPKSETEFFWKAVNAEVRFVKDAQGKVRKAIHRQGGRQLEAPRLE